MKLAVEPEGKLKDFVYRALDRNHLSQTVIELLGAERDSGGGGLRLSLLRVRQHENDNCEGDECDLQRPTLVCGLLHLRFLPCCPSEIVFRLRLCCYRIARLMP